MQNFNTTSMARNLELYGVTATSYGAFASLPAVIVGKLQWLPSKVFVVSGLGNESTLRPLEHKDRLSLIPPISQTRVWRGCEQRHA